MVKIKDNLKSTECDLWYIEDGKKDDYVGHIKNEIQFNDVRVQIKQEQRTGYMIYWNGHKLLIDKNGRLPEWPDGFYDASTNLLIELL